MSKYIQFDTSSMRIGEKNVIAAVQSVEKLMFNESFTVLGSLLKAPSIYASYDLTVIGDIEVDELVVRGNLFVVGNVTARSVSCQKAIICNGDLNVKKIASNEIVANNIKCHSLFCDGNIFVRAVIDVEESLETNESVISGEGILGSGNFSAKNAVAGEYFEIGGDVSGRVLELESNKSNESYESKGFIENELEDIVARLGVVVRTKLTEAGIIDEDNLIQAVFDISSIDDSMLYDWDILTSKLVELSYLDKITNFRDYLYVVMASKFLPKEITNYETLEHIFSIMLPDVERNLDSLAFHAKCIDDVAYALKIVSLCEAEMKISKEEAFDKILQAMGIKYKTAMNYLR